MKNFLIIKFICLLIVPFISSCSSFVKKEDALLLQPFEGPAYIMQQEVTIRQHVLPKNTKVKLRILSGDWIKVYAFRYEEDILPQKRMLLLYLFKDDFPNEKFDVDFFREKLYEVVKPFTEEIKDTKNTRNTRGR